MCDGNAGAGSPAPASLPLWWNGRRAGLRNRSLRGCRFESYQGHCGTCGWGGRKRKLTPGWLVGSYTPTWWNGRRAGLRGRSLRGCRFESCRGHDGGGVREGKRPGERCADEPRCPTPPSTYIWRVNPGMAWGPPRKRLGDNTQGIVPSALRWPGGIERAPTAGCRPLRRRTNK